MKVFYRSLYKEILLISLTTSGVLTVLLLFGNVFRQISDLLLNQEVSLWVIGKLVLLLIPFVLIYALPWGLLVGILLVFGRMSRDQELTILKASGIGLAPIIAPVLMIAFAFSLMSFWINASLGPRSQEAFREEGAELLRDNPLSVFSSSHVIDAFEGYRFYVGQHQGAELKDLFIWQLNEKQQAISSIHAERAEIIPDLSHNRIVLNLSNAREMKYDSADPANVRKIEVGFLANQFPLEVSLAPLLKKHHEKRSIYFLTFGELFSRILDPVEILSTPNMTPLLTELQKRISFSLAAFTFALVGIPLAIQVQRRETSVGFVLSLVIIFAYYLIITVAESLKTRAGFFPEIIIWLPNLLFEIVGFMLIIRANRR